MRGSANSAQLADLLGQSSGVPSSWANRRGHMSRYFFHIRDGSILVPDEEGMECSSIRAMEDEAQASERNLAEAALHNRSQRITASIEVEDEQGNEVRRAVPKVWLH